MKKRFHWNSAGAGFVCVCMWCARERMNHLDSGQAVEVLCLSPVIAETPEDSLKKGAGVGVVSSA